MHYFIDSWLFLCPFGNFDAEECGGELALIFLEHTYISQSGIFRYVFQNQSKFDELRNTYR